MPTILLLMQRHLYVQEGLQVNQLYDKCLCYKRLFNFQMTSSITLLDFKVEFIHVGGGDFQN